MERLPLPTLIWLHHFTDRCLFSGELLYADYTDLTILGNKTITLEWSLGICKETKRWYGMLPDLLEVIDEFEIPLETIKGFRCGDEDTPAGIWLGDKVGIIPWATFQKQMEKPTGPPPTPDQVRALPLLSEPWELGVSLAAYLTDKEEEYIPSYLALVLDLAVGARGVKLQAGQTHSPQDLAQLVFEAAARPRTGDPGRPLEVRLAQSELIEDLGPLLAEANITLREAPTPEVDAALNEMVDQVRQPHDAPFFVMYEAGAVRDFFQAAKAFYRIRPWDRLDGNKYLAFQVAEGPWLYANVIGQMGEEFGLSLFDDWLHLCQFVHNQPTPYEYLMAMGNEASLEISAPLEGMTLEPMPQVHPKDLEYLSSLGVKPSRKGLYPVIRRFSKDGLEPPHADLLTYQLLLQALTDVLKQRKTPEISSIKQTRTLGGIPITLRYPSKGLESFENAGLVGFRIIITGILTRVRNQGKKVRIEIDAPGDTRADKLITAIHQKGGLDYWALGISSDGRKLWSEGLGGPCPRIVHLATKSNLTLDFFQEAFPIQIMPQMGKPPAGIQVTFIDS